MQLDEELRVWASALAEALPLVSQQALPRRDEAGIVLAGLIADFSSDLNINESSKRIITAVRPLRHRPPPLLAVLEGHSGEVKGALELRDGRLLSWSDDHTLRLWSADGTLLAVLEAHSASVRGALELRDGRLLSWSIDDTLRLWSAEGTPLAVLEAHSYSVRGALELRDGRLLSWSANDTLRLWSTDGAPLAVLKGHSLGVNGALELRDGHLLSWS